MSGDAIQGIEVRRFSDGTYALVFVTDAGAEEAERRGFWVQMDRDAALDLHERLSNALDIPVSPPRIPTIEEVVRELNEEAEHERKRRRRIN